MSKVGLRTFKAAVLLGFPSLAFLYAVQFINSDREVIVPFQTFRAPSSLVQTSGAPSKEVSLRFQQPITVVNFWATWCPPCVEEFPAMIELQRQLEGKGVEIVFVSVDEKWGDVVDFQRRNNIAVAESRLFWDPRKTAAMEWGSGKFPESYVVRADGWVVEKIIGAQQWTRPRIIEYFTELATRFRSFSKLALIDKVSQLLMPEVQAASPSKAPDLIHEEDRKNLEKLRANIDVASKNLRNVEAALKEEKRNLEEQSVLKERRLKEEMEARKEVDKLKIKRNDVQVILTKNTDSQNAEKRERKDAEARIAKNQQRIKELQKELEEEKSRLQESNKDLNTRVQQVETYEEARKSSQEELDALDKRVKYADEALREKRNATSEAESSLRARERKSRDLEDQVLRAKRVLDDQKTKLTEFEKVLQK